MSHTDVEIDTTRAPLAPIEFDNIFQTQLETQFYTTVRRDHCTDPERCPECSSPAHIDTIKDAYKRLIHHIKMDSTSLSVKIQIILFMISGMNQYHYIFKNYPLIIFAFHDRMNEIECKKTRITNTWYIEYMNDIIREFYVIYKDQLMNR
jgi:hypothetical protein